ncbi:hypothetical protein ACHAWF_017378 [Thalassiosira exigua]
MARLCTGTVNMVQCHSGPPCYPGIPSLNVLLLASGVENTSFFNSWPSRNANRSSSRRVYHHDVGHRIHPVVLVQEYPIGREGVVDRPVLDDLLHVVEVVQQHLLEQRIPCNITCNLLGRDVVELVVLLHPQKERGSDRVVQLPPRDVAVVVLRTVLVLVTIRREGVQVRRRVVDAAERRSARVHARAEGSLVAIVLVAQAGEVVGGARDAEGTVVGARAERVRIPVEDVAVDAVVLEAAPARRPQSIVGIEAVVDIAASSDDGVEDFANDAVVYVLGIVLGVGSTVRPIARPPALSHRPDELLAPPVPVHFRAQPLGEVVVETAPHGRGRAGPVDVPPDVPLLRRRPMSRGERAARGAPVRVAARRGRDEEGGEEREARRRRGHDFLPEPTKG